MLAQPFIRPIIFRPSLIWTSSRPQALVSVIPFYIGNAIGIPFVDKPVMLESLVKACVNALEDDKESGIKRFDEIERLATY